MADDIAKAGKVLGQLEQLVAKESLKFDKGRRTTKRAFLMIAAADLVWGLINVKVEDMTNEDIEVVAEDLGMTLEEFAKAKPQTLVRLIAGTAIEETLERVDQDGVAESLFIEDQELAKEIRKVKV